MSIWHRLDHKCRSQACRGLYGLRDSEVPGVGWVSEAQETNILVKADAEGLGGAKQLLGAALKSFVA